MFFVFRDRYSFQNIIFALSIQISKPMSISTIFIIVCLFLGAIQGVIFGMILIKIKGVNISASRMLAMILFLISYSLLVKALRLLGIGRYDFWYHIFIDLNWIYGPLIFLFVKAHLSPNFNIRLKDWIYFLPVSIQFVASNFVRIQNFYWDGSRESLSFAGYWGYVIWMNRPTVYIIASLLIVFYSFKAHKLIKKPHQEVEIIREKANWIRKVILAFQIYFGLLLFIILGDWLVFHLTQQTYYYYFDRFYYYPFFMGLAGLTYWIGIVGFVKKDERIFTMKPQLPLKEQERLEELSIRLAKLMNEESLYKDPHLDLGGLAKRLSVKPYILTKCFKYMMNKKFTDYLQELRIAEVQHLLSTPAFNHYTLLGIAMEAGFNSKSSFNRAVKKYLDVSPSELRKEKPKI